MRKYEKLIPVFIGLAVILFTVNFYLRKNWQWGELSVYELQANIIEQKESLWNVEEVHINGTGDFRNIYFLDETTGYANDYNKYTANFYRTSDGGKSWEKVGSLTDFSIYDLFFVNQAEGFLVASKLSPSSTPIKNGSYIMKTEDGGKNWLPVFSSVNTVFNKIVFNCKGIGAAVGFKDNPNSFSNRKNLVLITKDKGVNWIDVSENLNQIAINPQKPIDQGLTNVKFSRNNDIFVLSLRGKVYSSKNQGDLWNLAAEMPSEPPQSGVGNFGELENGGFWMSGGALSIEGKWGMVATMNNNLWSKYSLNDYNFSDVMFLSKNEVIAVGSVVAPNNFGGAENLDKGVILYSLDSGKNWLIVYQSEDSNRFTSISKLTKQNLFIAGNRGIGVLLEKN